jgi:hypothetical protein
MRVDLNPARAAICDTLAESDHTTIQRRLREREGLINNKLGSSILDRPLKPVAGPGAAIVTATGLGYYPDIQKAMQTMTRPGLRPPLP